MGISAWYVGQKVLTAQLGQRVVAAEDRDDALSALAGLAALGDDALEPVVGTLTHQDEKVARAAFRILDQRISLWQASPADSSKQFLQLAGLLDALPEHTLPTRLQLAGALATRIVAYTGASEVEGLQQASTLALGVISRAADSQFQPTQGLIASASQTQNLGNTTGNQYSQDDIPGPATSQVPPPLAQNTLASAPTSMNQPSGVQVRFGDNQYTDPGISRQAPSMPALAANQTPRASFELVPRSQVAAYAGQPLPSQMAGTRVVAETAASYQVGQEGVTAPENLRLQSSPIQRVAGTVDLDAIPSYSVDQLVRLLASTQPQVAQTAAMALRTQGMTSERLALASRFAVGSSEEKLALMHDVVSGDEVNPRPWLMWMAEDRDPVVRRQAVSLLHSMVDDSVERELRELLFVESDPSVADTIRKVLAMQSTSSLR